MAIFCLDIGGTKTRARLDDQETVAGPAGALSLGADKAHAAIQNVWAAAKGRSPSDTDLFAGIAGISLEDARAELVSRL